MSNRVQVYHDNIGFIIKILLYRFHDTSSKPIKRKAIHEIKYLIEQILFIIWPGGFECVSHSDYFKIWLGFMEHLFAIIIKTPTRRLWILSGFQHLSQSWPPQSDRILSRVYEIWGRIINIKEDLRGRRLKMSRLRFISL